MTLDEALAACPIIAIIRGVTPEESVAVAEALWASGVRAVEAPLNSPNPLTSIRNMVDAMGDRMCVGAGTVLSREDVDAVKAAGGKFVVSPNTSADVIRSAVSQGLDAAPGFVTPTEAFVALAAGASVLKLFPASTFGPGHLSALREVLPRSARVLAVGGVGSSEFDAWRSSGAFGFGLGGELYRPGMSPAEVAARADVCVKALRS